MVRSVMEDKDQSTTVSSLPLLKNVMRYYLCISDVDIHACLYLTETNHIYRKLYIRIHPDLFQRYPKQLAVNEDSFQKLMGFFNSIKDGVNPKNHKLALDFYLRTDKEGVFEKATLSLKTSGGQCQHQAAKYLGAFFKSKFKRVCR